MIGSALRARQHVVNVHDAEREVRSAARANALLFAVQAMAVRPVVRQLAQVRAPRRLFQGRSAE